MMSRYTGRSLVVIVLRLCFVVAVAHAVRDSTLLYCSFTPEGCFFGYVVSTTWREDLFKDRWWLELMMRKIYSEPSFISISWNVDLNFNSLDVFFFFFDDFAGKISLWICLCCCGDELIEENERQFCRILWTSRFFYFIENDLMGERDFIN